MGGAGKGRVAWGRRPPTCHKSQPVRADCGPTRPREASRNLPTTTNFILHTANLFPNASSLCVIELRRCSFIKTLRLQMMVSFKYSFQRICRAELSWLKIDINLLVYYYWESDGNCECFLLLTSNRVKIRQYNNNLVTLVE